MNKREDRVKSSQRGSPTTVRILLRIYSWLCIILLPVVVVSAVVTALFYDASFYHNGEVKYDVQATTGLTTAQLDRVNQGIIRFFSTSESLPAALSQSSANPDVFKEKEILHMNDVRALLQTISHWAFVSFVVVVVFLAVGLVTGRWGGRAAIARTLTYGAAFTILLVLVTGVLSYTSFDQLFLTFHETVFQNNYWELDPRTDHLIQMFPFGFWYDAILTVALRVLVVTVALGASGLVLGRLERRQT